MSTNPPARKRLPVNPSLEHLKKQAKRFAKQNNIPLAAAQHQLATDYGARTWPELAHIVETMARGAQTLSGPSSKNFEPLPAAANKNDLDAVRRILAHDPFTQHDLDLALARSVLRFNERKTIAQLLIDHGADPNGQYGSNYGPILFVTGECLDPGGLQFLIDHGADVTQPPIPTKYGNQSILAYFLGSYARGQNERKHRGIEILLHHHAHIPPEVTPEILAIHRGDAPTLAKLLDQNPTLLHQHYPAMPYGNIPLAGATLLHAAVEFGELECLDLLLNRGANPNTRSLPEISNLKSEISNLQSPIPLGPTPIFHAIASCSNANFYTLEHLLTCAGQSIDMSVRASFKLSDNTAIPAVTPLEYAQLSIQPTSPDWCRSTEKEIVLLQSTSKISNLKSEISNLKSEISNPNSPASAFLLAATPDPESDHRAGNLTHALQLLQQHPNLPNENFYAACALGRPDDIQSHLQKSPTLATTPGGPRNWLPLLYLTFSKFLRLLPSQDSVLRTQDFLASAKILLAHHADPNSYFTLPSNATYKETALYGAAGIANNPALTKLLLDAGADPNDPESLYHAAEHPDNAALQVLLPAITNPTWLAYCMCHKMDMEDPAGLQLFLTHHADPNHLLTTGQRHGDRPLHFALIRHRSPAILQLLLTHGADPNLPNSTGITPLQLALTLGQLEAADLLLRHGAADTSTPKLCLLAALSTGNQTRAHELLTQHPALLSALTASDHTLLIDAAQSGNLPAVQLMLSPPFNFPLEIRKPKDSAWDGTPLHHAAYHAHPQTVQLLLQKGANPYLTHSYGGNALTTTLHAATHPPQSKTPTQDLPLHLQTLTLLGPHFSKEDLQKALTQSADHPELTAHLQSLLKSPV